MSSFWSVTVTLAPATTVIVVTSKAMAKARTVMTDGGGAGGLVGVGAGGCERGFGVDVGRGGSAVFVGSNVEGARVAVGDSGVAVGNSVVAVAVNTAVAVAVGLSELVPVAVGPT